MGIRFYNNINSQLAIKLMNCDKTVIKEVVRRRSVVQVCIRTCWNVWDTEIF